MRAKPSKKKQHANRKLAVRISGNKNVEIIYGKGPWVEDNKTINIPYRGVNYEEMLGLLAHEAGHIGYGSFSTKMNKLRDYLQMKYGLSNTEAQSLMNVVEDCRINRINSKVYPGFYRPLREVETKNLKELRRQFDFFTQLGLFMEDHIQYFPYDLDMEKMEKAKNLVWKHQHIGATVLATDLIASVIHSSGRKEVENDDGRMGNPRSEGNLSDSKHPINDDLDKFMDKMEKMSDAEKTEVVEELLKEPEEEERVEPEIRELDKPKVIPEELLKLAKDFNRWLYEVVEHPEDKKERICREETIQEDRMTPDGDPYHVVVNRNRNAIEMLRKYFQLKAKVPTTMHKSGRLNSTWIKAYTSDYKFPFTRDWEAEKVKITLMVDISGSMNGSKMRAAREAMIVFNEGLQDVADLRVILFCGTREALNIVVKDFGEKTKEENFNAIGNRYGEGENIDGRSLLYETEKNPKGTIIVFSDGRPCGVDYGLHKAIKEFEQAKPRLKSLWNFSIDAYGDHLEKLYDKNFVEVSVRNRDDWIHKFLKLGRMICDYLG